jgi:hypothetical protein
MNLSQCRHEREVAALWLQSERPLFKNRLWQVVSERAAVWIAGGTRVSRLRNHLL